MAKDQHGSRRCWISRRKIMPTNINGKLEYDYVDVRKMMHAHPLDAPHGFFAWERLTHGVTVERVLSEVNHCVKTGVMDGKVIAFLLAPLGEAASKQPSPNITAWAKENPDKIAAASQHAALRRQMGR